MKNGGCPSPANNIFERRAVVLRMFLKCIRKKLNFRLANGLFHVPRDVGEAVTTTKTCLCQMYWADSVYGRQSRNLAGPQRRRK